MSKAADALRAIKGGTDLGKATALPSIPNVPRTEDARVNQFLSAVKQTLETWGGDRGNELDSTVTWRNLIENGFATSDGSSGTSGVIPSWFNSAGSSGVDLTGKAYASVPPSPTNLQADGAFANILLSWDSPPYSNHSHTEIWRSDVNNLGTAMLIGMAAGAVYADNVGGSHKYYYWIKYVSTSGVKGPFNKTDGVLGETSPDPAFLLQTLTGQLQKSQLNKELSTSIELIGDNAADIVAINDISTTSTSASARAIAQVQARLDTGDYAAVKVESSATADAVTGIQAKYSVKTDVNGYVSGFGLISTSNNATPSSQFIFKADQFGFGAPGLSSAYPFVIQATATTVNGVAVPAGCYIDAAYIKNGSIVNAKIADAAIDNAKIASLDAVKINTGTLSADRIAANSISGAKLIANSVTADRIDSRGLSIKDAAGNIILAAGNALSTSNISGLGTLATQNSVTTGQVSGLGSLATLSSVPTTYIDNGAITNAKIGTAAVGTLNVAGNAITVPSYFRLDGEVYNIGNTPVAVIQGTVSTSGYQPIVINLNTGIGGATSNNAGSGNAIICDVVTRIQVTTTGGSVVASKIVNQYVTVQPGQMMTVSGSCSFTSSEVPAGTYYFKLLVECPNTIDGTNIKGIFARYPAMTILETKR